MRTGYFRLFHRMVSKTRNMPKRNTTRAISETSDRSWYLAAAASVETPRRTPRLWRGAFLSHNALPEGFRPPGLQDQAALGVSDHRAIAVYRCESLQIGPRPAVCTAKRILRARLLPSPLHIRRQADIRRPACCGHIRRSFRFRYLS